jgi:hypothetical protein
MEMGTAQRQQQCTAQPERRWISVSLWDRFNSIHHKSIVGCRYGNVAVSESFLHSTRLQQNIQYVGRMMAAEALYTTLATQYLHWTNEPG